MKKIIITQLIIMSFLSCRAQIVAYESDESIFIPESGAYYKDTNNLFANFAGEWKWEDTVNNNSITIILKKEQNIQSNQGYTLDLLVGEYEYMENGEVLVNTLADIDNQNISGANHKISGTLIIDKNNFPPCPECSETEKRMQLRISHDNFPRVNGKLTLRLFSENGIQKMKAILVDATSYSTDPDAPDVIDIPFGTYILIKQN